MEVVWLSWHICFHATRIFHPLLYTNLVVLYWISFHCYNFRTNHFNWLLKWMSATVISMSILGETIGTCILAYFILHETISLQQGLGITVIFIGLVLFLLQPSSNKSMTVYCHAFNYSLCTIKPFGLKRLIIISLINFP